MAPPSRPPSPSDVSRAPSSPSTPLVSAVRQHLPDEEPRGGMPPSPTAGGDEADARLLQKLGYRQDLVRAFGSFATFALSFSIISVLTGILTTYQVALQGGGPMALGLGWPLTCLGTLTVALSMAELSSAFPTAGALYHWSALLGGRGLGWFTAMMNLVGQVAIVAAIDLGCARETTAALGWSSGTVFPLLVFIVTTHGVLNAFSSRLVAWLNDLSALVHLTGVLVLVGALGWVRHATGAGHDLAFLFQAGYTQRVDGSYPLGFASGLMLGMYTFTGYDASAHVSEETHDAARKAPWGILSAVVVSALAGYALIVALTLSMGNVEETAAQASPALYILRSRLGDGGGRLGMGLAVMAMWFCGLSSVTSASRTLYAFARDGGVPFSSFVERVNGRTHLPERAVAIMALLPLGLVAFLQAFGDAAFDTVVAMATTGLYVSYAAPIVGGWVARRRGRGRVTGPFTLGRFREPLAVLAVVWSLFVVTVSVLPPNERVGGLLLGVVAVFGLLYGGWVRHRFQGPRVRIEAFVASSVGEEGPP